MHPNASPRGFLESGFRVSREGSQFCKPGRLQNSLQEESRGGVCGTGFLLAGGSRGWFLKASGVLIEPPSLSTGYLQTRGSGGTGERRRCV